MQQHKPICTCNAGFTGNPFRGCQKIPEPSPPPAITPPEPCTPSPCGPNAECRVVVTSQSDTPSAECSCLPGYFGQPPYCRPECVFDQECPLDKICKGQKCISPCPEFCGINAECVTKNHLTICECPPDYQGDPFRICTKRPSKLEGSFS